MPKSEKGKIEKELLQKRERLFRHVIQRCRLTLFNIFGDPSNLLLEYFFLTETRAFFDAVKGSETIHY